MVTKKKFYVSPYIKAEQIEVESSFAAASLVDEEKTEIVSSGQEEGSSFDASKSDAWSDNAWE